MTLRELYFDGCEKISDNSLLKLAKPRAPPDNNFTNLDNYPSQIRDIVECVDLLTLKKAVANL